MLGGTGGDVVDGSNAVERAAADARVTQTMIDVSAERLEGLRTQCATSAELTQQEIRTLEGKLMKLFSCQLVAKAHFPRHLQAEFRNIPCLAQWLRVVGLSSESVETVCSKVKSVERLMEVSEHELRAWLSSARDEEVSRLVRAMFILKKYTDALHRGESGEGHAMPLYWDSWDTHHMRGGSPRRARRQRASVPGEEALGGSGQAASTPPSPLTTSTPRKKAVAAIANKMSTTPVLSGRPRNNSTLSAQEPQPLTKSRSHESKLAASHRHPSDLSENSQTLSSAVDGSPPPSPSCEPGGQPDDTVSQLRCAPTSNHSSGSTSVSQSTSGSFSVPRSPHTPKPAGSMAHAITHRFAKTFNMIATCDYCEKQIVFGSGLKCKECKYKCHRDCEGRVPPSCCLPQPFVDMFRESLVKEAGLANSQATLLANTYQASSSPQPGRAGGFFNSLRRPRSKVYTLTAFPGGPDSSSASSCNSSTPSSPALVAGEAGAAAAGAGGGGPATPRTLHLQHSKQQFHFPEVKTSATNANACNPVSPARLHAPPDRGDEATPAARGGENSRPASLSCSISTDSERATRADSLEEGAGGAPDDRWPRQNSLSMKEWDIPYDELRLFEKLGTGRFGTVHRGSWHGDVAVKLLNVQYLRDDSAALDNFKHEVATFRKTRHENLVLFMGACMKPPKLAIVTSLCKGMTLYTHIHLHKDKFNANKSAMVAQQIAQGMGYLHARGIVHKDLKSKNIFLDASSYKVVITDFGLFSVTKLCFWNNARGDSLGIPAGWLCYLAPELVKALRPHASVHLPFSKASDVYAFGTVWYELLCGEWPFKGQPSEAVIWQVGKGVKQSLSSLHASRDVKDILMLCWAYRPSERPDFARLLGILEKLPRKRLARSPSHPVHLSRSAESVF